MLMLGAVFAESFTPVTRDRLLNACLSLLTQNSAQLFFPCLKRTVLSLSTLPLLPANQLAVVQQLDPEQVLRNDMVKLQKMTQSDVLDEQLKELKMSLENSEDFEMGNLFLENDDEEEDEDETSPDEGEKDDGFQYKKKINYMKKLEKLNLFMEENAPFPEKISQPKHLEIEHTKDSKDPTDEEIQENPSNLEEAFKLTLSRQDGAKKNEEFQNFQSSRPQENRFKYGTGMEFNRITESMKMEEKTEDLKPSKPGVPKASDDPRIKDSTDDSSDDGLKTSSSVKSSDDELKRKKDQVSTDSDASVKHNDKKLRFAPEAESSSEKKEESEKTEAQL